MSDVLRTITLNLDHDGLGFRNVSVTALREAGVPEAAVLAAVQAHLCVGIDAHAEALRLSVLTPGAGQALEYQEAQAQAQAALAAPGAATAATYPMLAATIGLDLDPETGAAATDVLGVARSVQAARAAWLTFGAAIRAARFTGKAAVMAAATVEAAVAAAAAVVWPGA